MSAQQRVGGTRKLAPFDVRGFGITFYRTGADAQLAFWRGARFIHVDTGEVFTRESLRAAGFDAVRYHDVLLCCWLDVEGGENL